MTLEFGVTELEAQPTVGIRTTVAMSEIGSAMGPLFGELSEHIAQSGQEPAGMPLARYHSPPGETVELECAIPVASPMPGEDRVRPGELPAGRAATVTHLGSYDGLPQTWMALTAWMESQGLEAADSPWEVYVNDPALEPDQSRWRTDIFFPVR